MKVFILIILIGFNAEISAGTLWWVVGNDARSLRDCTLDYQSHSDDANSMSEYFLTCDSDLTGKIIMDSNAKMSMVRVNGKISLMCPVFLSGSGNGDFVLMLKCDASVIFESGFE